MRMARAGLWSVAAWMAACGGNPGDEGTKPPAPPTETPMYAVKGTVSGLAGELTLQLNGQERLTRAADGPFAFETRLENQTEYTVGVLGAPAEQDCAVEGGTGRVAGADVESVRVRCAAKTYALGGTVEGARGAPTLTLGTETLALPVDGRFTFTTRLPRGGTYEVRLDNPVPGLRCTLDKGSGRVAGAVEDITVRCHDWYTLATHAAARGVLGQADFTHRAEERGGPTGAGTLNAPLGSAVVVDARLYVSDRGAHRLLGFSPVPTLPGADAGWVLGQTDFTADVPGTSDLKLNQPAGLGGAGTRLAVADQRNSRVLLYTPPPLLSATPATLVLGQEGFDTSAFGCTPRTLGFPQGVFLSRDKVLVADTGNHRVLVWNTPPTTNGQPADLVLGQQDFTHCRRNDANGDGTSESKPGPTTLYNPTGVWTDGQRLVVVDSFNNRVLVWTTFPTTHGQPADVVLGQRDFTTSTAGLSATAMDNPTAVTSTGAQLFVADTLNHRVLVWNTLPTTSDTPPDRVLGQADFTHNDREDPPTGNTPSARSLAEPSGITLAWPHVVVTDSANHRVLLFASE
ncbi:NHL repeat-containing protein [Archangium primigenium]|nr:NHL repeat-containing protein [Archangium primigenium]